MTILQALVEAINNFVTVLELFTGSAIVLTLLAITLKNERFVLYLISGLATFSIGISWAASNPGISYVMMALSTYELLKFIEIIYESAASRGWSQFKGIYQKITHHD